MEAGIDFNRKEKRQIPILLEYLEIDQVAVICPKTGVNRVIK